MGRTVYLSNTGFIIILISAFFAFTGCKGSDTREEVDSTVEEFAGKKKIEQMEEMKRNIGDIQKQQSDRLNQLNTGDDGEDYE